MKPTIPLREKHVQGYGTWLGRGYGEEYSDLLKGSNLISSEVLKTRGKRLRRTEELQVK
jgi:hypothetical protein